MTTLTACLRCGSMRLRMPSVGAGDAFMPYTEEIMGTVVCERCGYKSVPLSFETKAQLDAYRGEREAEGWKDWKTVGGGQMPMPAADARPRSALYPTILVIVGLFFFVPSVVGAIVFLGGNQWLGLSLVFVPLLLGIGFTVVGLRQLRARQEAS